MTDYEAIFHRHLRRLAPIPTGVDPHLSHTHPYAAMLFDVYGTLLISGAGEIGPEPTPAPPRDTLWKLLRRYKLDFSPDRLARMLHQAIAAAHSAARRRGVDYPEVDLVRIWQVLLGSDDLPWLMHVAMEYELIVNPVWPMPGAAALMSAGKAAGLALGVISNAQFYTPIVLAHVLGDAGQTPLDQRLRFYSWREGFAKPSTVMFQRAKAALWDMGIPAASVLYVGNDMRNDLLPAASVGFKTALFAGDRRSMRLRRSDQRCRRFAPDLIVTDLRQLIAGTRNTPWRTYHGSIPGSTADHGGSNTHTP